MAILVDEGTKVVVAGITGSEGTFHSLRNRAYGTQVVAVAAFLRVLNALENIRQSIELLEASIAMRSTARAEIERLLNQAVSETVDSIRVLEGGGLHPAAVAYLKQAKELTEKAACSFFRREHLTQQASEA